MITSTASSSLRSSIENQKGGSATKEKFNVNTHLKALHIRFLPEQEQEMNISSREFLKQAEFINVESLLKKDDEDEPSSGGDSGSGQGGNSGGGSTSGGGGTTGGDDDEGGKN